MTKKMSFAAHINPVTRQQFERTLLQQHPCIKTGNKGYLQCQINTEKTLKKSTTNLLVSEMASYSECDYGCWHSLYSNYHSHLIQHPILHDCFAS